MSKKSWLSYKEAIIGTIIITFLSILSKLLNMWHWHEVQYNLISYYPYVCFIGLIVGWIYILILWGSKGKARWLVIPTSVAVIYNIYLTYGIFQTYTKIHTRLLLALLLTIILNVFIYYLIRKD